MQFCHDLVRKDTGRCPLSPQACFPVYAPEKLKMSLGKGRIWMRARLPAPPPQGGRGPGKYIFVESVSTETI